jgi:3-hydroxyisobutyryl-CoA hydrolase
MITHLHHLYTSWTSSPTISCIILKGSGDKAFCAGGDVKTIAQLGMQGKTDEAMQFFQAEYILDHLISTLGTTRYSKPHVAFIDCITMGGGVGVSVHGTFRVATERTIFAMPELAIGLIPDVGGSWFLPRLGGGALPGLGRYLAFTGARLKGRDVKLAGIATHYIHSSRLAEVQRALVEMKSGDVDVETLNQLLCSFEIESSSSSSRSSSSSDSDSSQLSLISNNISKYFGDDNTRPRDVIEACRQAAAANDNNNNQWAAEAADAMAKVSPTSLAATHEQLRRGARMHSLVECLEMENTVVYNLVADRGSDFYRGVDAVLISKTGNPGWRPGDIDEVDEGKVGELFDGRKVPRKWRLELPRRGAPSRL